MIDIKEFTNKMSKECFIEHVNVVMEECPSEFSIEYEHPKCDGGNDPSVCNKCWENALFNVEFKPCESLVPVEVKEILTQLKQDEITLKKMNENRDILKSKIKNLMEQYGVEKWENDGFTVTYVEQGVRSTVDSKKLLTDYPEIYSEVIKQSIVKPSVKFKVK